MTFTSVTFLSFLAVVFLLYFLVPKKAQWSLLLVASLLFYLFSGVKLFPFLLLTVTSSYFSARFIGKRIERQSLWLSLHKDIEKQEKKDYKAKIRRGNRAVLIVCLVLNFGILFFCKAALLDALRPLFEDSSLSFLSLALPIGISYYMLQSMGYLIDVYRGTITAEKNPFKFALFACYFPQLLLGPINRWGKVADSYFAPHSFDLHRFYMGAQRMVWGFFKKLVIADRIAPAIGTLKGEEYDGVWFFVLITFYAVQIYGDFTGGIDIAIGISEIFGIKQCENFDHPYLSKSIAEYWRRWHMSLGEWMKDYVFYPLSVSTPMLKLVKKSRKTLGDGFGKRLPVYIASIVTWLLTGIWHGFELHFIVWGMSNCAVIVLSEEIDPLATKLYARFPKLKDSVGYTIFRVLRTFILMNVIRSSDLFAHVSVWAKKLWSMFTVFNFGELFGDKWTKLGLGAQDYIVLGLAIALVIVVSLTSRERPLREKTVNWSPFLRYGATAVMIVIVLLFGAYGQGYNASAFIYTQF